MADAKAVRLMESIYARVDKQVREIVKSMLPEISMAIQADGSVVANHWRIVNFVGDGVTVTADPVNHRTTVFIPGGGAVANLIDVVSNTTATAKTLWNGSSNDSPPANWYGLSFTEDGTWSAAVAANQTVGAPPPTGTTAIWKTAAYLDDDEANLFRQHFTLSDGVITGAQLIFDADGFMPDCRINGVTVATKLDTGSTTGGRTVNISPTLLNPNGADNVIAMHVEGTTPFTSWAAWDLRVLIGTIAVAGAFQFTAIRGTGNKTTTSATFVAIDGTNLPALAVDMAAGDVVRCMLACQASSGGGGVALDFQVVQPTLGTTRTNNSAANGATLSGGGARTPMTAVAMFTAAEAGLHTFQAMWQSTSGTATIYNATTSPSDTEILFSVENLGSVA